MLKAWVFKAAIAMTLILTTACLGPSRDPAEGGATSSTGGGRAGDNADLGAGTGGGSATPSVTYSGFVAEFMERSCHGVGCHSGANAVAPPLETYDDLVLYWEQSLDSMEGGRMPIGLKEGTMTPEDVENFQAWVDGDFAE